MCVAKVPLAHDYWCVVGVYVTDKLISWYFYSFVSLILVEFGLNLFHFRLRWAKCCWRQRKNVAWTKNNYPRFSITVIWIGSSECVNSPVIFLEKEIPGKAGKNGVQEYPVDGSPGCIWPYQPVAYNNCCLYSHPK